MRKIEAMKFQSLKADCAAKVAAARRDAQLWKNAHNRMQTKANRFDRHRKLLYAHFKRTDDIIWAAETPNEYEKQAKMAAYKKQFYPKMKGEPCIEAIRLYKQDKARIKQMIEEKEDESSDN